MLVRLQLRRKKVTQNGVQVNLRRRLPGLKQPTPFYLDYINVPFLSAALAAPGRGGDAAGWITPGDRRKVTTALSDWLVTFQEGTFQLHWIGKSDGLHVQMERTENGCRRSHALGVVKACWVQRRVEQEQRIRAKLLEVGRSGVEIDWPCAERAAQKLAASWPPVGRPPSAPGPSPEVP